jgi:hypothetical protein
MFPEGNWGGCCDIHDKAYWIGGTYKDRLEADRKLRYCVASKGGIGHKALSYIIYVGARIGGCFFWPVPWRWGYGHRWPKDHR